nr:hypothetical protein [Deltaproteobacteria bacterium]
MRSSWLLGWSILLLGCGMDAEVEDDDYSWADGKADGTSSVNIAGTNLDVDLTGLTAVATIDLERNGNVALEVGGLAITAVHDDRGNRRFKIQNGTLLVSSVRGDLVIEYGFAKHAMADGLLPGGSTVIWPYFCGNLFPCHSQPADGTTFTLALSGVPDGKTAVFPESIDTEAPPYMLA